MSNNENNDFSDQTENTQVEDLTSLCKNKGTAELVDIIVERAGTVLSSTQLDTVIEEYRQGILHQGRYSNVQAKIRSVRKRISNMRTEQEKNRPKKSIEIRAEAKRRSKAGYTRVTYDMPFID